MCLSSGEAASFWWLCITDEDYLQCLQNDFEEPSTCLPSPSETFLHVVSLVHCHSPDHMAKVGWGRKERLNELRENVLLGNGNMVAGEALRFWDFLWFLYHCSSNNLRQIISSTLARILEWQPSRGNYFNSGPKKLGKSLKSTRKVLVCGFQ